MSKLPSFQFYPGDWLKDPALRRVSKAAKGVWIDMICLSFECEERGIFASNGVPWPDEDIAAAVGGNLTENLHALSELLAKGVCSRNQAGAVFCRRVVRDEQVRQKRVVAGRLGGNPDLCENYHIPGFLYVMANANGELKLGASANPKKRLYKVRDALGDDSIELLKFWPAQDMGRDEKLLHDRYERFRVSGEWFQIPDDEKEILLKGTTKGNGKGSPTYSPPPSSSSSASTSDSKGVRRVFDSLGPPIFEPVPKGLFPREYEKMMAHCDQQIKAVKQGKDSYERVMRKSTVDLVSYLESSKPSGWEQRVKEAKENPEAYERGPLKPNAAAVVQAWVGRRGEIERVMNGIRS